MSGSVRRRGSGSRRTAPRWVEVVVKRSGIALLVASALLAGCVSVPTGPSTLALPGSKRSFDEFQRDDGGCRQYAFDAIGGGTAANAQTDSAARSLLAGAAIGAMIGGAVSGGHGAAVGAGVGGAAGSLAGLGASEYSGSEAQRRYDNAYTQCMYAKGHRVAVSGYGPGASRAYYYPRYDYYRPAPAYYYPPPPPGGTSYYAPPPPPASGSAPPPPPPGSAPPPPPPGSAPSR
jgi:hypothetical protein